MLQLGGINSGSCVCTTLAMCQMHGQQSTQTTDASHDSNATVCVFRLKIRVGFAENRHIAQSCVCAGTMFHVARSVKNRIPKHVVQCFLHTWWTHHGVPQIFVVRIDFSQECEDFLVDICILKSCWLAARFGGQVQRLIGRSAEHRCLRVCH